MNIRELKEGDRFEVIRNQRRYTFIRYSSPVRPRDCIARNQATRELVYIDLRTSIRAIGDKNEA
jgi:hypothetical protein